MERGVLMMHQEKKFCVYKHTNKQNHKVYIGITSLIPEDRWQEGIGYKENNRFLKDILKYGWDGFNHEILYRNLSEVAAKQIENDLILEYDSYNCLYGYNQKVNYQQNVTKPLKKTMIDIECVRQDWMKLPALINPYISQGAITLSNGDTYSVNKAFDSDCILLMLLVSSQTHSKDDEYLSNEKIAQLIGISVSAVKRAINLLCILGIISKSSSSFKNMRKRTMYFYPNVVQELINGTHWLYNK